MKSETEEELVRLIFDLDSAIAQAVENPLLFVDSPTLGALRSSCLSLSKLSEDSAILKNGPTAKEGVADSSRRADLLWQVRIRAGRLQMLMDSAARFYASCFSPNQQCDSGYGVHGEWSVVENPSYLAIDC